MVISNPLTLKGVRKSPMSTENIGQEIVQQEASQQEIPYGNIAIPQQDIGIEDDISSAQDEITQNKENNSNLPYSNQMDSEILELRSLKLKSPEILIAMAMDQGIENVGDMCKQDIIYLILKKFSEKRRNNIIIGEGVLEVLQDGFGFLRSPEANYRAGSDDMYVSPSQIKRFGLRTGDIVKGQIRAPKKGERYFALLRVNEVNYNS